MSRFTGFDERFQVFYDGALLDPSYSDVINPSPPENGQVVIGRHYVDGDYDYVSVELDELVFFNRALEDQEIQALYQYYN